MQIKIGDHSRESKNVDGDCEGELGTSAVAVYLLCSIRTLELGMIVLIRYSYAAG